LEDHLQEEDLSPTASEDHFLPHQEEKAEKGQDEFEKLNLPAPILAGIRQAGFNCMTPIQRKALPALLAGHDLCGQAQTGTGKTATFLITLLSKLLKEANPKRRYPLALILAPTRELALQIYHEAKVLGAHTRLRLEAVYGGEGYSRQEKMLRSGVDIVVATPGRLLDFARRRVIDISRIRFLVIDESDRLLEMGFWDELRDILRRLPPPGHRQSMLFSATLDYRTKQIASSHMNQPRDVAVQPEQITAEGIDQLVYYVDRDLKFPLMLGIFSREKVPKGLIFANQKVTVAWLAEKLNQHGYKAAMLTGDLPQNARNRVLERFKQGQTRLLVASDVASRGLHIDDVTHIINYDLPQDPEDYVHRIGRTARAGKRGKAYTLACDEYCRVLPYVEDLLGQKIPYEVPYDEDYGEDKTPEFTIKTMLRRQRQQKQDFRPVGQNNGRRPWKDARGHRNKTSKNRTATGHAPRRQSRQPSGRKGPKRSASA